MVNPSSPPAEPNPQIRPGSGGPMPLREAMAYGRRCIEQGELDAAEDTFQTWSEREPSAAEAWIGLGMVRLLQLRSESAIPCFEKATQADPINVEAWLDWGIALTNAGKPHEAMSKLARARTLDSANAEVHFAIAICQAHRGRSEKAAEALREALRLDPSLERRAREIAALASML